MVGIFILFILLALLFFIVVYDAKKRWPDTPWTTRLYRVLTFSRD